MNRRPNFPRIAVILSLALLLLGAAPATWSAWASMEDAALFYDELSQYGEWVEYGNYGPVWYPTNVKENWRPYLDGRWTPAEEGQVFETQEPWGWATYHYGNWMPTEEYGWVWVPGRTWYPNTVTWRTSTDSEAPEASYIGWAPVPPPNYTPPPGYYPEGYSGGSYFGSPENLITAPFWIFIKAASFLLGFGQPYTPAYSYWGCGSVIPPPVVPYYITRTVIVHNYYSPSYYPAGYMVDGVGYYNWGPPVPYLARVTRIKQVTINNYIRQVNIYQRANVVPPAAVFTRRAHFREMVPPAMVHRHPLPRPVHVREIQAARAHLARPNLVNVAVIKNAPTLKVQLPKVPVRHGEPGQRGRGVPGAALPASAMMRPDPKMQQVLQKIPPHQRLEPVSPRARKWQVPPMPGAEAAQPVAGIKGRGPESLPGAPGAKEAGAPKTMPPGMAVTPPSAAPPAGPPQGHGAAREIKGPPKKGAAPEVLRPGSPKAPQAGIPSGQAAPGQPQPGTWTRPEQTPRPVAMPEQVPGKKPKPAVIPGKPPTAIGAPAPGQAQPQVQPPLQVQPQAQPQPEWQKKKYTRDKSRSIKSGEPGMTGIQPVRPQPRPPMATSGSQPPLQSQPPFQPRPRVQPQPKVMQQPQVQPAPTPKAQPRPQAQAQPRPQAQAQPKSQAAPQPKQGKGKPPPAPAE
ncbi:MAG: DUF6600 domain-containing protein [Desulfobaccales bacterium]